MGHTQTSWLIVAVHHSCEVCFVLCLWIRVQDLVFLKYQADQSCICSGKAEVYSSLSIFSPDYFWTGLQEITHRAQSNREL